MRLEWPFAARSDGLRRRCAAHDPPRPLTDVVGALVDRALHSLGGMLDVPRQRLDDALESWRTHDWRRDPFTPVVENGYLFCRGATDMKLDGTLAIAALGELRREGFRPPIATTQISRDRDEGISELPPQRLRDRIADDARRRGCSLTLSGPKQIVPE